MDLTQDDAPSQPVAAGLRPFSGELSTRWERQKQAKAKWRQKKRDQAREAGYRSAWEMRKTKHHAKHGYTPTASAEPATPLLDRLEGGSGPARTIPVSEWREREPAQPGADTRHLAGIWK